MRRFDKQFFHRLASIACCSCCFWKDWKLQLRAGHQNSLLARERADWQDTCQTPLEDSFDKAYLGVVQEADKLAEGFGDTVCSGNLAGQRVHLALASPHMGLTSRPKAIRYLRLLGCPARRNRAHGV